MEEDVKTDGMSGASAPAVQAVPAAAASNGITFEFVKDTYIGVLKKFAVFEGRARRQEFWTFFFCNLVLCVIPVVNFIVGLVIIIPNIALSVRRLHDTNRSGKWLFLGLVPLAGSLMMSVVGAIAAASARSAIASGRVDGIGLSLLGRGGGVLWLLGGLVTLVSAALGIMFLVWAAQPGTVGGNKYGPDPKAGSANSGVGVNAVGAGVAAAAGSAAASNATVNAAAGIPSAVVSSGSQAAAVPAAAASAASVEPPAAPATSSGAPVNRPIPKDLTAMNLLSATKPFVIVRALVYAVVTAIMIAGSVVVLALCWAVLKIGNGSAAATWVALIFVLSALGAFFGFLRFAKRYCLYMIKAAHVSAITEYLRTGAAPVTEKGYKGVLAYGKETVSKHFGAANIAFVADALIARATRQIMRWVNRAENLLSFIPGSQNVFKIVNFILSTALNFIDEAVLSYIFYHKEEKSSFKKACDGLVYYAQAWKGMLMGAAKTAVFVWVLRAACFIVFYGMAIALTGVFLKSGGAAGNIAFLVGVIFALSVTYGVQTVIVEPYATCMMIKDYHIAIAGQPLKADMYGALCNASKSFKELFNKSKESPAAIAEGGSAAGEAV